MYQLTLLKCLNRILYLKLTVTENIYPIVLTIFIKKVQYFFKIFKTFEGLSKNNKIYLLKVKNKTKWEEIK